MRAIGRSFPRGYGLVGLFVAALMGLWAPARGEAPQFAIGGNFQIDRASFDDDVFRFEDDIAIRRARLSATAKHSSGFEFKIEYDLESETWTDAYIRHTFAPGHSLRVGQFKQPVFLDELTSDRITTFMEEALPSALGLARREGIEYQYTGAAWSLTTSAFGRNLNLDDRSDSFGLGARATWLPWQAGDSFLHLGASVSTEEPKSGIVRFSARPEAALANGALVNTGRIEQVGHVTRAGLEAAWVRGAWSLQGEFLRAHVSRSAAADVDLCGAYAQASWFPSGHARRYRNTAMDGPLVVSGHPAWELALRYSRLDLDDAPTPGGRESNWTVGLNFQPTEYLRLMANYVDVRSERDGMTDDPGILEFRVQLAW